MFDTLIQVAAGWVLPFVFFWFLLSFMASAFVEWIDSILRWRSIMLDQRINLMLGKKLGESVAQHVFFPAGSPSTISVDVFKKIIIDIVTRNAMGDNSKKKSNLQKMDENISILEADHLRAIFEMSQNETATSDKDGAAFLSNFEKNLGLWFESNIQALREKYRRRIQVVLLIVGVTLAAQLNFDVIALTSQLWESTSIKESAAAGVVISEPIKTSLPLFWTTENIPCNGGALTPSCANDWATKVLGITIGGVLISIGGPVVYDLRNKGKKP